MTRTGFIFEGAQTMPEVGPDQETLAFAIAREIEAHRFYLALADRVESPQMRKALEQLAAEELEHKAKLELEVMKLGRTVAVEDPAPPDDDDHYIVSDTDSQLDMDYRDILLLSIEKEDASFKTYVNLAAYARNQDSRDVLLAIAEQEVQHKLRFQTEYDLLTKQK